MIRVVIGDDFGPMLLALEALIESVADMEVVGKTLRFDGVAELLEATEPDVVVINDYVPPLTSGEAAGRLRGRGFSQPILVVSMHNDADLARAALAAGANGFLLKTEAIEKLEEAIRAVHAGETYVSDQVDLEGEEK